MLPCPACDREFATEGALDLHVLVSRLQPDHLQAEVRASFRTVPRPYACTHPACKQSFPSRRALIDHQGLVGHQPVRDSVERGDGDAARPGPKHPALRPQVTEEAGV